MFSYIYLYFWRSELIYRLARDEIQEVINNAMQQKSVPMSFSGRSSFSPKARNVSNESGESK